jgi:fermentation-respiration switch protein FrsA (DUF1100 family)
MINRPVTLKVEGLKLWGQLYLPGEGDHAPYPAICICHGIPAERHDPKDRGYPLLAERICREGLAALIFKFRGVGASEGNLDLPGWTRDLKAAIDYLAALPEVDSSRLSLLGFSGGAAVSMYVAAQDKRVSSVASCASPAEFASLITDDGSQSIIGRFRDIGVIRDGDFPPSVDGWLDGFRSVSPVRHVADIAPRPLLLVHGNKDEVVTVSHAYKLYAQAGEPKQIIIVDGAEHRLRQNDRAMAIVIDWLKSQLLQIDR